mmetsp:Transcript_55568/g.108817  ORF Transcript_55568/g.108817 Transcript_55568/m.108817 type:complete len:219 (-) Transcript_55568:164-820(-)
MSLQVPHLYSSRVCPGGHHEGQLLHRSDPVHTSRMRNHSKVQNRIIVCAFLVLVFVIALVLPVLFINPIVLRLVQLVPFHHVDAIPVMFVCLSSCHHVRCVGKFLSCRSKSVLEDVEGETGPLHRRPVQHVIRSRIVVELLSIFYPVDTRSEHLFRFHIFHIFIPPLLLVSVFVPIPVNFLVLNHVSKGILKRSNVLFVPKLHIVLCLDVTPGKKTQF